VRWLSNGLGYGVCGSHRAGRHELETFRGGNVRHRGAGLRDLLFVHADGSRNFIPLEARCGEARCGDKYVVSFIRHVIETQRLLTDKS
jgi:hypothetical protein